jgi:hypothetical protein
MLYVTCSVSTGMPRTAWKEILSGGGVGRGGLRQHHPPSHVVLPLTPTWGGTTDASSSPSSISRWMGEGAVGGARFRHVGSAR